MTALYSKVKPPREVSATATAVGSVSIRFTAALGSAWPVAYYRLYRGGSLLQNSISAVVLLTDSTVAPSTTYDYSMVTVDSNIKLSRSVDAAPVLSRPAGLAWLLSGGIWNDLGYWNDSALWED